MAEETSLDNFLQDIERKGFGIEPGKSGYIFHQSRDIIQDSIATMSYKECELVFSVCPSSPEKRAEIRKIANKYNIPVRSATMLSTSEPELGLGSFW